MLSLLTFSSLLKPRFQSLAAGTSRVFEDGNALYLADVVRIGGAVGSHKIQKLRLFVFKQLGPRAGCLENISPPCVF